MSLGSVFLPLRRLTLRLLSPVAVQTDAWIFIVEQTADSGVPMIKKDYYLILGVPHEETAGGIQAAFRELAKRYHPDRAGPEGTGKFQDIQEAYRILSDPDRRRMYNDELEQEQVRRQSRPEPIFSRSRARAAPLVPEPLSVLRDFETIRPSFESLFDRFVRNFTGERIPKGERLESLNVEVILSPEEAAWVVTIPVAVPVFHICTECRGSGHVSLFPCVDCGSQGVVEAEETVMVRIPPVTLDRAILEVPIHGVGIHNFYLRLHIRVARPLSA
jgi:DnaJ-class molecular chaperone